MANVKYIYDDASIIKFGNICPLMKTKELPPVDSVKRARCKAQEKKIRRDS